MKREITDSKTDGGRTGILIAKGKMSEELRQNARQTMGELRDLMRETGLTWELIESEIDLASCEATGIRRALDSIDPYTTGIGRRLEGLAPNI